MLGRRYLSAACCLLLAGLVAFNVYYFFVHRQVGPGFYLHRLLQAPADPILSLAIYQDSAEEYERLNEKRGDLPVTVFLGDSITRRFHLGEYFPGMPLVNRGIFHDTTEGLLARLDRNVNNLRVDRLFLLIGHNDLPYRTDEEIVENIALLLSRARAREVILQSILPVAPARTEDNRRIVALNERLQRLCPAESCTFLDLHARFRDGRGGLRSDYSRDGIHPNAAGYEAWAKAVRPLLE